MDTNNVRKLFPQLLQNGYVPLPNRDKACMLPKWSTVEVDERQCRRWARQTKWPAIGLRIEPPLLVLDYDLPDAAVAAAVRKVVPARAGAGLERIGSPPKTAFFLRLREGEEPFREAHTRRYHFDGARQPAFAVQAFAGGGGAAQFGAFGPHSHNDAGQVLKSYSWVDDRSPANVPIDRLPELSRAEVFAALDAAEAVLRGFPNLVVDAASKSGEAEQAQVYDITEDTVFVDVEGVSYSRDELEEEAKARKALGQPNLRLTGSFTGDPASTGSPRAKVHWSERHGLSVVDFKTSTTHHLPRTADDPDLPGLLNEIFKKANI